MSVLMADTRRDFEIHRFPVIIYALVPLASLVLQAWLPRVLGPYAWFDLPLVITVYFALGRRSPIQGTLMGSVLGLFEDALTHQAIGINGIAKTIVGFLAASVGVRIDVDSQTIRARSISSYIAFCWDFHWSRTGWSSYSRPLATRPSRWFSSPCSTACRSETDQGSGRKDDERYKVSEASRARVN
jgi:hypothetical protein